MFHRTIKINSNTAISRILVGGLSLAGNNGSGTKGRGLRPTLDLFCVSAQFFGTTSKSFLGTSV